MVVSEEVVRQRGLGAVVQKVIGNNSATIVRDKSMNDT